MRIIFTFTDDPNLSRNTEHKYSSTLIIPDAAYELADVKTRVLAIAELVALLSNAYVFVSCKEIGIEQKLARETGHKLENDWWPGIGFRLSFKSYETGAKRTSSLNIYHFPRKMYGLQGNWQDINASTEKGAPLIRQLIARILELGRGSVDKKQWYWTGFDPRYSDPAIIKSINALHKAKLKHEREQQKDQEKQQKTREREELKRQKREEVVKARQLNPDTEPKTGAGRTVGARPGVFDGVMMRSQLEIRFAAELKERNIRWIYEGETLGEGGYLVDFYLPDLGVWVEVKGKFEARDRQLLPQVAATLKERKQSLFVYTNSTCYKVNPSGLREIPRKDFWGEVVES